MQFVIKWEDVKKNLYTLEAYRNSINFYDDYVKLMKRGTCFVVYKQKNKFWFGPSRFVGYLNNDIELHKDNGDKDGRDTNKEISEIVNSYPEKNDFLEEEYINLCLSLGFVPNKTGAFGVERKYWFVSDDGSTIDELKNEEESITNNTEKKSIISARIGQAEFRQKLINYWKGCAITSSKATNLLRASHIKPWKNSNDQERLDVYNGLLLIPNLDLAFDQGLITFENDGHIMISKMLEEKEIRILGIHVNMRLQVHPRHKKYLEYHRKHIFIS